MAGAALEEDGGGIVVLGVVSLAVVADLGYVALVVVSCVFHLR